MDPKWLNELLENVQQGTLSVDDAMERLRGFPYEDVDDFARLVATAACARAFQRWSFAPARPRNRSCRSWRAYGSGRGA